MDLEKNIYGLSEGVFQACQFLGLTFPPESVDKPQPVPSDYFGDDFELDSTAIKKLCAARKWTNEQFTKVYKYFSKKFSSQKPLKHTKTDLNVCFCDFILAREKQNRASSDDYFAFELYNKSFACRSEFITQSYRDNMLLICNEYSAIELTINKSKANKIFADFLHRDWIDVHTCTFEEFKTFIEKHPRSFSKLVNGAGGSGAQILSIDLNENLEEIFANLKSKNRILEEVVVQHESLQSFCPNVINTIRVYTFLDVHNAVHILSTSGRFGRAGGVVDNFHGGGICVIINPKTGIIASDAINNVNERFQKHPDTGKTFKGFQYPSWEKICKAVKTMAKMIPQLRYLGWDIAIDTVGEPVLIEVNGKSPDVGLQQAADSVGRLHLYEPLFKELQSYKKEEMRLLGYRVNNLPNFDSAYERDSSLWNSRRKFAISKLIPDCESLMDLGCRQSKFVKTLCPKGLKYYPVDFKKHDDEVIACNFNRGEFPDIKSDTCLCALTAEFVENLPQFLANMCNAARKQILMFCRPIDKEIYPSYKWEHPFLTDFTEEFLIKTMEQNNFKLNAQLASDNKSVILYDFRKNDTDESFALVSM